MLYRFIWGCTVRPLQSEEGKCVVWAGCSEPLFFMLWALRGISAGAIMSTEIVDDEEDETRSVSRTSSITLIGRMNLFGYRENIMTTINYLDFFILCTYLMFVGFVAIILVVFVCA